MRNLKSYIIVLAGLIAVIGGSSIVFSVINNSDILLSFGTLLLLASSLLSVGSSIYVSSEDEVSEEPN
jgi:hypothetical protein